MTSIRFSFCGGESAMPHYVWQSNLLLIISAEKAEGRSTEAAAPSSLWKSGGRAGFSKSPKCPELCVPLLWVSLSSRWFKFLLQLLFCFLEYNRFCLKEEQLCIVIFLCCPFVHFPFMAYGWLRVDIGCLRAKNGQTCMRYVKILKIADPYVNP